MRRIRALGLTALLTLTGCTELPAGDTTSSVVPHVPRGILVPIERTPNVPCEPGGKGGECIVVTVENIGDAPTSGFCDLHISPARGQPVAESKFDVPRLNPGERRRITSRIPEHDVEEPVFGFRCSPGPEL